MSLGGWGSRSIHSTRTDRMIEILSNGALNLIQDTGRPAHLIKGVCRSGAMDAPALALANMMIGNDAQAAGIEISIFPFRIRFDRDTLFACTGVATRLALPQRSLPGWWAAEARSNDILTIAAPTHGARAYLALQGGLDVPLLLGSRATDLKSGFGGLEGRGLRKGDQLPLLPTSGPGKFKPIGIAPKSRVEFAGQLTSGTIAVRALPAAEYDEFTEQARHAFKNTEYRLTPDCNRQGYRLDGQLLETRRPLELLSHGVIPGTVQVPPSGQPIVQMAEANTLGGYPKIATVIEADLWRLAQIRPGQQIRFSLIDHEAAVAAQREQSDEINRIQHALDLMVGRL